MIVITNTVTPGMLKNCAGGACGLGYHHAGA